LGAHTHTRFDCSTRFGPALEEEEEKENNNKKNTK
jgi:hypothetical protein